MTRKYGAPYIGSKNNIAEKVIDFLPAGQRLCDLFGGGGAISHCALTYGRNKYKSVLYNDYNPMVVDYVKDAFNGKFNIDENEPDIITREDFRELKDKRGDVAFLWSFGNNGMDYLWGEDKEELKLSAFAMLTRRSIGERYKWYKRFMSALKRCDISRLMEKDERTVNHLQSIEAIERIQSIHQFKSAGRIQFSNISYTDYKYKDGDIVYCDIPYENAKGKVHYADFDHKKFYEWACAQPYPVFISSYEVSDERLKGVTICRRNQLLTKTSNDERLEKIFMNEAAVEQKKQEVLFI